MSNERIERIILRNKAIEERYTELSAKKYKRTKLYSQEAIFQMLSDEFYLSPRTIEDIVCGRTKYKE